MTLTYLGYTISLLSIPYGGGLSTFSKTRDSSNPFGNAVDDSAELVYVYAFALKFTAVLVAAILVTAKYCIGTAAMIDWNTFLRDKLFVVLVVASISISISISC